MKRYYRYRRLPLWARTLSALLTLPLVVIGTPAMALPQGGTVRQGEAGISSDGTVMTVTQQSGRAIIQYESFNIGADETVRFVQPDSSSAVLNRVIGGSGSTIAGALVANGQVYLINPHGILFTPSANVNVGALIAAAMNMSDSDFMDGQLRFSGPGGAVVNQGSLSGARVYLFGGSVENLGTISASDIVMAAGRESIVLDRVEGGQIRLVIDGQVEDEFGVSNTAEDSTEDSTEESTGDNPEQGAIAASVVNEGSIDVSGESGGSVWMQGERVGQFGETRADGSVGDGGTIVMSASDIVVVGSDSITTANAGEHGDGGTILIVGEDTARIGTGARIEARGGSESGDGGFVETSGRRVFEIGAEPDVGAAAGDSGTWYIDPHDITIADNSGAHVNIDDTVDPWASEADSAIVDVGLLTGALDGGATVWIQTQGGGTEQGNITVVDAINYDGIGGLTLDAHNNIVIGAQINNAGTGFLTLLANSNDDGSGNIAISEAISLAGGSFTASGVDFANTAPIATGGGNLILNQTGNITVGADLNAGVGVGAITLMAGSTINQTAGTLTGGTLTLVSGTTIGTAANRLSTSAGQIEFDAAGDV